MSASLDGSCPICTFFGAPTTPEHPAPNSQLEAVLHTALAGMTPEQTSERCDRIVPRIRSTLGELRRWRLLPYGGKRGRPR